MKNKEKKFDAVAFQRKRRQELSILYYTDRPEYERQLKEIRKKYDFHVTKRKGSRPKPLIQE
jgi:hypothetical protein